jgi:aconitate hydratase
VPFDELNAKIFTNACGPCIGQWAREGADLKEKNTIVHSFNRNFAKRADGNPNTHAFVASPEMVAAIAISGRLDFNPLTDSLINSNGEKVKLDEPTGWELPPKGFEVEDAGYLEPVEDGSDINVVVDKKSERLQLLDPFKPWDGKNITNARLLIKALGKCTTDHISMAGPWLRYRGHLDNISNNCLIGAINAYNEKTNFVKNQINGEVDEVPNVAREYKAVGIDTIVVGDHNYGEGSSREHAAMEPRHLGVRAVIVKSFARIHETNLKKQGMLGLTFNNENDYDLIREDDVFNFLDLKDFAPKKTLLLEVKHSDGTVDTITLNHTYNDQQIEWFKYGSALNLIKTNN